MAACPASVPVVKGSRILGLQPHSAWMSRLTCSLMYSIMLVSIPCATRWDAVAASATCSWSRSKYCAAEVPADKHLVTNLRLQSFVLTDDRGETEVWSSYSNFHQAPACVFVNIRESRSPGLHIDKDTRTRLPWYLIRFTRLSATVIR